MANDERAGSVPPGCTLTLAAHRARIAELDNFFVVVRQAIRSAPTRLDLVLPRDAEAAARRLAERERQCCSFFSFAFEPAEPGVVMHVGVSPTRIEVLDALQAQLTATARCDQR